MPGHLPLVGWSFFIVESVCEKNFRFMLERKGTIRKIEDVRELHSTTPGKEKDSDFVTAETREAAKNRAVREELRLDKLKATIAREFIEAKSQVDRLARANDDLLRLVLRLPPPIRHNRGSMDAFYRDLCQRISLESQQRGLKGADQYAREEIFKLRPSIEQLVWFIEATIEKNPDIFFATSPEFDVEYLVDLLASEPIWDSENNCLRLRLKLIQAKSGILDEKLEREKIRELAEKHRSAANILLTKFELDIDWIRGYIGRLEETSAVERIVLSFSEAFALLTGEEGLFQSKKERSPLEMFSVQETAIGAVNDLARELEIPEKPLPKIILDSMSFVFLVRVKTKDGRAVLKELTLDEALGS